ncbi:DUF1573 domain-containing protein [Roseimaritima sediminicola]|uniref:DUF1573 domain-containing protein n=1 Tax=Roseimaritima sediminicola TaxID=2662066 RepID=UPI0012985474|nr:DUF1573 domain-containing protein [Roseimaritima sediminicola]
MNAPNHPSLKNFSCASITIAAMLLAGVLFHLVFPKQIARLLGAAVYVEEKNLTITGPTGSGTVSIPFHVHSLSSTPVTIIGAIPRCGCTFLDPLPTTIEPGGRQELTINVDFSKLPAGVTSESIPLILDSPSIQVDLNLSINATNRKEIPL